LLYSALLTFFYFILFSIYLQIFLTSYLHRIIFNRFIHIKKLWWIIFYVIHWYWFIWFSIIIGLEIIFFIKIWFRIFFFQINLIKFIWRFLCIWLKIITIIILRINWLCFFKFKLRKLLSGLKILRFRFIIFLLINLIKPGERYWFFYFLFYLVNLLF